jgi:hypothetical protein
MKKIMISPCAVTNTLNVTGLVKNCIPGSCSSARIATESVSPTSPAMIAKIR